MPIPKALAAVPRAAPELWSKLVGVPRHTITRTVSSTARPLARRAYSTASPGELAIAADLPGLLKDRKIFITAAARSAGQQGHMMTSESKQAGWPGGGGLSRVQQCKLLGSTLNLTLRLRRLHGGGIVWGLVLFYFVSRAKLRWKHRVACPIPSSAGVARIMMKPKEYIKGMIYCEMGVSGLSMSCCCRRCACVED